MQVGRYGGLEEEVEHLKRDKNVLMLELVRLRQQQQVFTTVIHYQVVSLLVVLPALASCLGRAEVCLHEMLAHPP